MNDFERQAAAAAYRLEWMEQIACGWAWDMGRLEAESELTARELRMERIVSHQRLTLLQQAEEKVAQLRAEAPRLRPEVLRFAIAMEAELRANAHKGGWKYDTAADLLKRVREEVDEVAAEVRRRKRDPAKILAEAADVGNMIMMVADVAGGLGPVPSSTAGGSR